MWKHKSWRLFLPLGYGNGKEELSLAHPHRAAGDFVGLLVCWFLAPATADAPDFAQLQRADPSAPRSAVVVLLVKRIELGSWTCSVALAPFAQSDPWVLPSSIQSLVQSDPGKNKTKQNKLNRKDKKFYLPFRSPYSRVIYSLVRPNEIDKHSTKTGAHPLTNSYKWLPSRLTLTIGRV